MTPILIKAFRAAAAIQGYLIIAAQADGTVNVAKGKTEKLLGAAGSMGARAAGDMLDVDQAGWSEVRSGGNVSFGDLLTSDANGKAVTAETGDRTIGIAMQDGSSGDIIPFRVV